MNTLNLDIAKHIVNVYKKRKLDEGEVLNKYEHLLSNKVLYENNIDMVNKLSYKVATDEEVINFVDKLLYSALNEGFYNPYDDDTKYLDNADKDIKDVIPVNNEIIVKDSDGSPIKGVRRWDSNVNGKIYCRGGKMYSGRRFIPNDVLEECPVIVINNEGMFSRTVRDMAFQLYPDKEIYGIPLGYANCYDVDTKGDKGNVDYEFEPTEGIIRIIAISDIKPNNLLILRASEDFIK